MNKSIAFAFMFFFCNIASHAHAALISGVIEAAPESTDVSWGPSEQFSTHWSVAWFNSAGWFYGTDYQDDFGATFDLVVLNGVSDISNITDASLYSYTSDAVFAAIGDTILMRNSNGYYGAWIINNIFGFVDFDSPHLGYLDAEWYFLSDGSADFSIVATVNESSSFLLLVLGLMLLGYRRA